MTELHEALAARVDAWRAAGYAHERFPAVAEILGFAFEGPAEQPQLRYLRAAQLRALETYWYLRLVEQTVTIPELYARLFERTTERLTALGLAHQELRDFATDFGYEALVERIRTDDDLVRRHRLDALRETLTLDGGAEAPAPLGEGMARRELSADRLADARRAGQARRAGRFRDRRPRFSRRRSG